jgi:hypothetical protein
LQQHVTQKLKGANRNFLCESVETFKNVVCVCILLIPVTRGSIFGTNVVNYMLFSVVS